MDLGSLDISCYRQIAFTCAQDRMMQRRVRLGKESDALACHAPYQIQALTPQDSGQHPDEAVRLPEYPFIFSWNEYSAKFGHRFRF